MDAPEPPEVFECSECHSRLFGSRDNDGNPVAEPVDGPKMQADLDRLGEALRESEEACRNWQDLYQRAREAPSEEQSQPSP